MKIFRGVSLMTRVVVVFAALLATIAAFLIMFFPARMESRARQSTTDRAVGIAKIMASAAGAAVDFSDGENAARLLHFLEATPDALYGVVRLADGTVLAGWHADLAPAVRLTAEVEPGTRFRSDALDVAVPVHGLGGAHGTLEAGFSLSALAAEITTTRRTVTVATVVVMAFGLMMSAFLTSILVRPIRKVTETARLIAAGDAPPCLELFGNRGDEVGQMAEALDTMLKQLADANRRIAATSRQAGMAEVATGVLHNVGNVLNSVNVSVTVVAEQLAQSQLGRLRTGLDVLASVLEAGADDERRAHLVPYFTALAEHLEEERTLLRTEVVGVTKSVEHVKQIVAIQNAHARPGGVTEIAEISVLLDEVLLLDGESLARHSIAVERRLPELAPARIDRHGMVQILVNLLKNAKDALKTCPSGDRRVIIAAEHDAGAATLTITVTDNGQGIRPEDVAKIFAAGFTTKEGGHGYGLHSSALAAAQMGGELTAHSDGPGCGARFALKVPYVPVERKA